MTDLDIYREIVKLNEAGVLSSLATVVESTGSSPRKAGAKMLVRSDGTILGTVGGGKVETEVIGTALDVQKNGIPRTVTFTLTEEYGHVCGGSLLIYIEPNLVAPRLVIFGAGHVGRALAAAAKPIGFRVTMIDEREGTPIGEEVPGADETIRCAVNAAFDLLAIDANSYLVIATSTHEDDFAAVKMALRTPARFIGLLGSRRKRAVLEKILADEGFRAEAVNRVTIPVGLAIGAESPAEIAVSVVAQLVQVRKGVAGA